MKLESVTRIRKYKLNNVLRFAGNNIMSQDEIQTLITSQESERKLYFVTNP